jgi:hypothetical protein
MGDLILLNGIGYECSFHKLGFFQPLPTVEPTDPSYLGILALRLWLVHRRSLGIQMTRSRVYPILLIIIECGALYSMSLVTMLAAYLAASNSSYIVIDMVYTPQNEQSNPLS